MLEQRSTRTLWLRIIQNPVVISERDGPEVGWKAMLAAVR